MPADTPVRTPRARLGGARLIVGLVLALLVPGALVLTALAADPPAPPPTTTALRHPSLPQAPDSVAQAQLDRSGAATRAARRLAEPRLLTEPGSALPTLALAPRSTPYTLAELRERFPRAFAEAPGTDGALLLAAHVEVPVGASLVIDDRTPDVRLTSGPSGFATIVSRGTTTVAGTERTPVRISSWDPAASVPDAAAVDGRSFVLQIGGRMDVAHGRFEHLGFGTGTTSGVAWRGAAAESDARANPAEISTSDGAPAPAEARVPAQGTVTDSVFAHNHFGAYTHEAVGMRWAGNTFAHNEEYGFDPHDFSNDFVVERNTAHHNGKHGFIFSRGCERNVLRDNTAYANVGHGFMIDDGRSVATETAEARINPSNDNVVARNVAYDNAGSGVEIEGGTGNVVAGNDLARNDIGVRVKDGAAVTVADNAITGSVRYGVHVLDPAARVSITGNRISGSWAAVNLAAAENATANVNTVTDVSTPLVVGEVAQRDPTWVERAGQFVRWNPVLVLWGLILGVPLVAGLVRVAGAPARLWRRSGLARRVRPT